MYSGFEDLPPDIMDDYIGNDRMISDVRVNLDVDWRHCTNLLSDDALYRTLQALQFDMGFLDGFMYTRCYAILLYRYR